MENHNLQLICHSQKENIHILIKVYYSFNTLLLDYSKGQPYKSSNPSSSSSSDTIINKENDSTQSNSRYEYSKDGYSRSSKFQKSRISFPIKQSIANFGK